MQFAAATTTYGDVSEATRSLAAQLKAELGDRAADLLLLYLSPHFVEEVGAIVEGLQAELNPQVLMGCSGEGVIGREREIEDEPAITAVAAHLPQVRLTPFRLHLRSWADTLEDSTAFHEAIGAPDPEGTRLFVVLADPFSTPMEEVLAAFNQTYGDIPVVGGMASAARSRGGNVLLLNKQVSNTGVVGVAMAGAFDVDVIVSQGCRPIGQPFTITAAENNVILTLDDEPPLVQLQTLFQQLSPEDQELLQNGLFIGRAIASDQEGLGLGNFLIRGVIGADQQTGAIAVGDYVREGDTMQFHVRDARTAEADLEMLLLPQALSEPATGVLLFSCNGRGTRLYDHPDGDITTIQKTLGNVPLAGFFCAGELGPVGGINFLHGHTASLALLRPQATQE